MTSEATQNRLAGYAFLIEKYRLSVLPNWNTSSVSPTGTLRSTIQDGQVESIYPQSYWPGDSTGDHLEFALKYDGVNLGILSALFEAVAEDEITAWITSKPSREIHPQDLVPVEFDWERAPLRDLTKENYVELLRRIVIIPQHPVGAYSASGSSTICWAGGPSVQSSGAPIS